MTYAVWTDLCPFFHVSLSHNKNRGQVDGSGKTERVQEGTSEKRYGNRIYIREEHRRWRITHLNK